MAASKSLSLERAAISASKLIYSPCNAASIKRSPPSALKPITAACQSPTIPRGSRSMATVNMASDALGNTPAQELDYLRNITKANPFISEKESPPEPSEFQFPPGTLFKAPDRGAGLAMADMYSNALREHGICGIEMGWSDPESRFIQDIVKQIRCIPDTHSSTQGVLWDVKYNPKGVHSDGTGKKAVSISHSMGEFAWHTDGAFEEHPTRYFGFHIIHPDKAGGGVFRVLRAEDIVRHLRPEAVDTLSNYEFDLKVPPEFYKGKGTVKGKLLDVDPQTGRATVRFRKDILQDPPSSDSKANSAIRQVNDLLDAPDGVGEYVPEFVFKENMVLLMDNARYLHSRTDIRDPKRWLRRIRFHGTPGKMTDQNFPSHSATSVASASA